MGDYLIVLLVGLAAGAVGGVIGTGSSIMLLPVLIFTFGPKQAVPIMAVASVMANVARVIAWWREIHWRAFVAYSITGIPAAVLGARTLWVLPARTIDIALGIFFIIMIPVRYFLKAKNIQIRLWQLAVAGGIIGYLTGMAIATGPLSVPAFTAFGLAKGAFISTEAVSSLGLHLSKVVTFQELGALPFNLIVQGLIVGGSLMLGTFVAKEIVKRMSIASFQYVLDVLLFGSGLSMLWASFQAA
ncbi:sulfite exporter TauE/SafE family protein [Paenibacillus cremeus]|uniref:Probable membrane transporter protein n=1 Tax=Paenibacillus cremeus TaxID=2163881 RepID=A0A559K6X0_9BACL|nr:sulfite exporter TauE/SafE family protein [Paenibacillus cremeus]TVY07857.1 sulfite exporter TauE/SafE family protein [Paenibacillus cremeus]